MTAERTAHAAQEVAPMETKHRLALGTLFVVSVLASAAGGMVIGFIQGRQSARIEDWKVYSAAIAIYDESPRARTIELRDFLKARYYHAANNIPENWLGSPPDYGPVDFGLLPIGKGPTSPREEYRLFKAKKVRFTVPAAQP